VSFIHISLLHRILTSTHMKYLIFFCIIYVAISNIHFSGHDNVKMSCITHKFHSKLLLGKNIFTLKFVDVKNETSISIWEFEKMNVLK